MGAGVAGGYSLEEFGIRVRELVISQSVSRSRHRETGRGLVYFGFVLLKLHLGLGSLHSSGAISQCELIWRFMRYADGWDNMWTIRRGTSVEDTRSESKMVTGR